MLVSQVWNLDLISLNLPSYKRTIPAVFFLAQYVACNTLHVTHSMFQHIACHTLHVTHCMLHLNTCIDVLVSNNLPSFCFVSAMKESGRVIPLRKTPWGVFRLGRVKSLETLGTMVVVIGLY